MQRLRPLDETECYLRCYGWIGSDESVRVLRPEEVVRHSPGFDPERVRLAFDAALDAREPEAA